MKANRPTDEELARLRYKDGKLYWVNPPSGPVKSGDQAGSINSHGYVRLHLGGKRYAAHRLIYFMHHGEWPEQIDHINGIRDDNRIENLRAATQSQNQRNRDKWPRNKSGVKNVHWNKQREKWQVSVFLFGKQQHFGFHKSLEFAELVAISAREKYHGEFANHE